MDFDLRHNIRELERGLSDAARREVRGAVAAGINATLKDIKANTEKRWRKVIDRPTPFTMRGLRVRFARDRTLTGAIFVMDRQAEYLINLEKPGTVHPEGAALPVPGAAQRLNKYGNLSRGAIKRGFASPKHFSGTPRGGHRPAGLWKRAGTKRNPRLVLMALWAEAATYARAPLRFKESAAKTAKARLPGHILRRVRSRLTRTPR
ncbi:hypothetical protein [Poseidonocella sp. HB161398]|uniref:hypothetical protein n=1 Tax=Poseidonocella sp. HB161398 TaxID=2320855 RepID=UPI0011088076|nr:hypothetical protein [Poseidonocella sp. HB161398]